MKKEKIMIIALVLVIGTTIASLINLNNKVNKLNEQYNTQVEQLQEINARYEFDSSSYFIFGNEKMLVAELNGIEEYKSVDNAKYYVLKDTSYNKNILLKVEDNKISIYGKFDADILPIEDKEENVNNLDSILDI